MAGPYLLALVGPWNVLVYLFCIMWKKTPIQTEIYFVAQQNEKSSTLGGKKTQSLKNHPARLKYQLTII